MKIQYASDLHLELADNFQFIDMMPFEVSGDVLVLAGDIGYLHSIAKNAKTFLKWASQNYRQTLIVPGNHEYYSNGDMKSYGDSWKMMLLPNVGYYQNQVIRIDDTDFVLSTLWSQISEKDEYFVWKGMNDFRQIYYDGHRFNTDDFNAEHKKCLDFIQKNVEESTAKHIVVVTHHLPTLQVVAAHHKGTVLNSAFATEFGEYIVNSPIDVWIYGHSHENIDATLGKTRILSNQLGYVYYNEHLKGFGWNKYFEFSNKNG